MKIGIFDIGWVNFAFAVELYPNKEIKTFIKKYEKIPKQDRIIERRQHSVLVATVLKEFYAKGETLLLELTDLNKGEKCGMQNSTRKNLNEYLKSKKDVLKKCNYIIIEAQFKTGQACNFDAILLGEATYSWCVFNLDVPVEYTPSRYKTCILGCPRTIIETKTNGLRVSRDICKKDRKEWSKKTAIEILTMRGDKEHIEYITSRKGDDVSDCILMGLAWVVKRFAIG